MKLYQHKETFSPETCIVLKHLEEEKQLGLLADVLFVLYKLLHHQGSFTLHSLYQLDREKLVKNINT